MVHADKSADFVFFPTPFVPSSKAFSRVRNVNKIQFWIYYATCWSIYVLNQTFFSFLHNKTKSNKCLRLASFDSLKLQEMKVNFFELKFNEIFLKIIIFPRNRKISFNEILFIFSNFKSFVC